MAVPTETAKVVEEAMRIGNLTDAAFDIMAAPLVDLWGFGPAGRGALPSEEQIDSALRHVGLSNVWVSRLATDAATLSKQDPQVRIDLSALAKGYAVDAIAQLLDARGIHHYLIELGGELRARGHSNQGRPWRIGLEEPDPQSVGGIHRTVDLLDQAIATSGTYRNSREGEEPRGEKPREEKTGGVIYPHLLDPRTRRPVGHALVSVSVIAKSAMCADAWATALMVLGPKQGFEVAVDQNVAAIFLIDSGGPLVARRTPAFMGH